MSYKRKEVFIMNENITNQELEMANNQTENRNQVFQTKEETVTGLRELIDSNEEFRKALEMLA